jgi:hypothetical protein
VPAGFHNRKGLLVRDPRWMHAVNTMRTKGLTFRAIAEDMTKQGNAMTAATVYRVLAGKREVDVLTPNDRDPEIGQSSGAPPSMRPSLARHA